MKWEGSNLNTALTRCPLPAPWTNISLLSLEECKMTSYFYLPHCNNIFNYWLNCKCPVSHLNKSHMYEIVVFSGQFPAVKIDPHRRYFFLQLIENTAHVMHELKHPGGISTCISFLQCTIKCSAHLGQHCLVSLNHA